MSGEKAALRQPYMQDQGDAVPRRARRTSTIDVRVPVATTEEAPAAGAAVAPAEGPGSTVWRRLSPAAITPGWRLVLVGVLAVAAMGCYIFGFTRGSFEFAFTLRSATAGAMLVAAFTQSVATVVFHTVTDNRILTPSIMGFDSMFVLMQTVLVTLFGGGVLLLTDGVPGLLAQTGVMVLFATLLYRWLFSGRFRNLYVLLLVGVVFGMAFESISTFLERLLHPTDYDKLSVELFGRMTDVDRGLLPLAFGVCAVTGALVWRHRHVYDGLLLGREASMSVGIDHRRELTRALILVAVLVSFSTALVGPMTFFGFVVATLAYELAGTYRHAYVLPMAVLLGVIALAGGQFVLQHVFYAAGFLTVIIEFVGGLLFLAILLRKRAR